MPQSAAHCSRRLRSCCRWITWSDTVSTTRYNKVSSAKSRQWVSVCTWLGMSLILKVKTAMVQEQCLGALRILLLPPWTWLHPLILTVFCHKEMLVYKVTGCHWYRNAQVLFKSAWGTVSKAFEKSRIATKLLPLVPVLQHIMGGKKELGLCRMFGFRSMVVFT